MADVNVDVRDALALVGVVNVQGDDELRQRGEVATAPAVSPAPAAPASPGATTAGQASSGGADRAVGQPDGGVPPLAMRVNSFPRPVWRQQGIIQTQAGAGFLGSAAFVVPSAGTLIVTGAVAKSSASGAATGFQLSTDGGNTFYDVLDGSAVDPGKRFKFAEPVYPGDEIDLATKVASAVDSLRIMFQQDITTSQVQSVSTTTADTNITEVGGTKQTAADWSTYLGDVDGATGTPGSATPTRAMQVAGTDGTDARALATDATGALKLAAGSETIGAVTEADLDDSIQAPGSAAPAKAVQVAGTDGTDTRVIATDASGRPHSDVATWGGVAVKAADANGVVAMAVTDPSGTGQVNVNEANGGTLADYLNAGASNSFPYRWDSTNSKWWPLGPATADYVDQGTAATATTPILANYGNTASAYTVPANGTLNVAVAVSAAATLTMARNASAGSPSYNALNNDTALTATAEYLFSTPVRSGEVIDFELSAGATIEVFDVFWVPSM